MGAKSGGSWTQVSKSPHPIESNRMCLIPPASNYDNMCEMFSTKEVHRDSVPVYKGSTQTQSPRFLLKPDYTGTFCLACTQIPNSQKKSKLLAYTFVCTDNIGTVRHACQLWNGVSPP